MSIDTEKLAKVYIKIRDARRDLKKKFDEEDGALKAKLEKIEGVMLTFLNENKQESARTTVGTFFKQEEVTPTAADWDAIYKWIKKNDAFEMLERRIKKTFVSEYMEAHKGSIPPGVSVYREYVVRVRRNQ
jgi:hypothetical protein